MQIDQLQAWLNTKGVREYKLNIELTKQYAAIVGAMKKKSQVCVEGSILNYLYISGVCFPPSKSALIDFLS